MKKQRHTCHKCGAKKYTKYMVQMLQDGPQGGKRWECANTRYCVRHGANYKL